jgi:hypothetical protein
MNDFPFIEPNPDLGTHLANLMGGRSMYKQSPSQDQSFIFHEFTITNLARKLPIEQLEAEVFTYLSRRGFKATETDKSYIKTQVSILTYVHPQYNGDTWVVLTSIPDSRREVSVSISKHSKKAQSGNLLSFLA